jgi:VWFA-related protein
MDNRKPQRIASFEEHTPGPEQVPHVAQVKAANFYSNNFLLHPPPAFDLIMLNTATIPIVEQMYLSQQLTQFIKNLPPGQELAIFVHAGEYTILLQNFTSDREALLAALSKAIPRLPQQGAANFADSDALHQMAVYLGQLPGRKNVMWFTGGSVLALRSDPTKFAPGIDLRAIYDELDRARIAIYPIDVRGPIVGAGAAQQHFMMEEQAEATGGRAVLNTNGLGESARKIIDDGASFYTLSYSPSDNKLDNKWHKVRVEVDGGKYRLSYRRGYYDDGSGLQAKERHSGVLLKAGGEKIVLPDNRSEPIIFTVTLLPGFTNRSEVALTPKVTTESTQHNQTIYTLHYSVPAAAFSQTKTGTSTEIRLGAGFYVLNSFGRKAGDESQEFTFTFDGDKLEDKTDAIFSFEQPITLPKGEDYLNVAVWDIRTGRLGTVQIPLVAVNR